MTHRNTPAAFIAARQALEEIVTRCHEDTFTIAEELLSSGWISGEKIDEFETEPESPAPMKAKAKAAAQ